tara:strand:- start:6729 stop:7118 length:390 start_codon:yes stop_codon:yes gene_type:complete
MPTIQPREYYSQQIHYLRKSVTFADDGTELTMGVIPSGSLILKALSGVNVDVAFNAGTTNTVDIGTDADPNLYGTALAAGAIASVPLDEAVAMTVAADTTMTVTVVLTGTAATAGNGEAVIAYIPDNDG